MSAHESLELLFAHESSARQAEARRFAAFMRLLIDDARSAQGGRVGVSLDRATGAMERQARADLRAHLIELLRLFLRAILGTRGRGEWIAELHADGVAEAAWAALHEHRTERPWLAGVPRPDESAASVARRLWASLDRLVPEGEDGREEVELWAARVALAEGDGSGAERRLRDRLEQVCGAGDRIRLLGGLVEVLLERGAVLRADALFAEHAELALGDERLLDLRATVMLLRGEASEARSLRALLPAATRRLPTALVELRERVPEWAPQLSGRAPEEASVQPEVAPGEIGRSALGAAFLGFFRPSGAGVPNLLDHEVAPGWRRRLPGWEAERSEAEDALTRLQREVVATARPVVVHGAPAGPTGESPELRGVLGGSEVRALALAPVLDARGETLAWLHLEFEHHLVPSAALLGAVAQHWLDRLPDLTRVPCSPAESDGVADWCPADSLPEDEPRARFFHQLVDRLAMKTAQRRWWGFVRDGEELRWVATGGGALGDVAARRGGARSLDRVARCGVPIRFDEPDPGLSLHADAASGVVLPLELCGASLGCFVVESERRRDFRPEDVQRLFEVCRDQAPVLRTACFRHWHRERYGADLFFDVEHAGFGRRALDFALTGRSDVPAAICGPAGSGKEVLARWLHFERADGEGELTVLSSGSLTGAELDDALETREPHASPQTLVVDEVEALEPRLQRRVLEELERRVPGRRLVVTTTLPLAEAVEAGRLDRALAARLARVELFVPPLCERRAEVPGIARLAAERFAEELGVPRSEWKDAALALLWRQPWSGNVRELEDLVYKLVLLYPGETVDVERVRAVARRFRLKLQKRLPSRHPSPEDLLGALRITRKRSGNPNKTRAALYLGWDPDTLVARMKDAGLDPRAPFADRPPSLPGGQLDEDAAASPPSTD